MSGIAHCPSCSSTRTDAAGGCLSCGRKSVDQLPPTPTTDRDELVERLTERANIVASVQRYYVTGLGGMELEKDLRQAAARIQADAATIADLVAALKQTVHLARAYSSGTGSIFEKAMTDAERSADRAAIAPLQGGKAK